MPRLSVLMPARDAEATIAAAVRTTLAALPRDAGLAVLDDGSRDRTAEIVAGIQDRRLVLLSNSRSTGVAGGLRLLLESTDSEVIGRMDADDLVLPGRFRAQLRELDRGAQVVFAGAVRFGRGQFGVRPTSPIRLGPAALRIGLLATNPVSHPTLLASRRAVETAGGYRDCTAEDYDLWLRLAARGARMTRMRRPVLAYRRHPAQVSGTASWRAAAVTEPAFLESYDRLASAVIGVGREDPIGFRRALARAAASVRGVQGAWLRRQVAIGGVLGSVLTDERERTTGSR